MNNFAAAVTIGVGLSVYTPGYAADFAKPDASKTAPSSSTGSVPTSSTSSSLSTPATSSAGSNATAGSTGAVGTAAAGTGKGKHHKVAHKHKKNELVGDGEPLSDIGKHKNVDGGFDFDNSKKFVK